MKPRKRVSLILQYVVLASSLGVLIMAMLEIQYYYLLGFDGFIFILLLWVNLKPILRFVFKLIKRWQNRNAITEEPETARPVSLPETQEAK